MAVTAFSFTPKPITEISTYLGSATIDEKEYPVRVWKRRENGIHRSTLITLATYPTDMAFEEAVRLEKELAKFVENNDVW